LLRLKEQICHTSGYTHSFIATNVDAVLPKERPTMIVPPRLLVVEDDPIQRSLLQRVLVKYGYAVDLWDPSTNVLATITASKPELVLMDLSLGNVSGWHCIQQLWSDPVLCATPVIVCSGSLSLSTEQNAAIDAHNCAYMSKPYNLADLVATVARYVPFSAPGVLDRS
jgi:two-component system, OmpR family, KDP operon response regulator KdpE